MKALREVSSEFEDTNLCAEEDQNKASSLKTESSSLIGNVNRIVTIEEDIMIYKKLVGRFGWLKKASKWLNQKNLMKMKNKIFVLEEKV